jgi:hypothetical protein
MLLFYSFNKGIAPSDFQNKHYIDCSAEGKIFEK